MIAGQSADLLHEKNVEAATEKDLLFIQENKTGKLIFAAVAVPCVLSGNEYYYQLREYALTLGLLFQITDDILDVTGDFAELGKTDPLFAELDRICSANNGLWCKAAEDYLLANAPKVEIGEPKEKVIERRIVLK